MGAVCDNASVQNFPKLEDVEGTRAASYEECAWPQDPYLRSRIEEIRQSGGAEEYLQERQLKKHVINNEYYLGEWDVAGYQKGKGILYRPGQLYYQGGFDTVPHGNGTLRDLENEVTYEGEFNHGKVEGYVKLTKPNNYCYEGTVNSDGQPTTGKLVVQNPDSSKAFAATLSNYPVLKARVEYQDGSEYEGYLNLKNFLPEGEGISRYPNNCIYEGEWLNGEFHGKGKFSWPNASEYVGEYRDGKKHGQGRFTYPSKKIYEGSWVEGKQQGYGQLFEQSGDKIRKGHWKNGVFDKE